MLENLFTNVFGRSKSKSGSGRNSQSDTPGQTPGSSQMTGPFSSMPQMPQPPNLAYPAAPYPPFGQPNPASSYYPSLPFSQPPSMPAPYGGNNDPSNIYGTLANHHSPLDSVPFEAKLTLNNSTNLVSLDQLFKEIKKTAEVVERADTYLRSNQSDYNFKTEQGILYQ
jgi:hypothetical protein